MTRKILLFALVAALALPTSAFASMYVGASIGNTWQSVTVEADDVFDEAGKIDENSTGWKIFGGFKSESIFGIEGGYRDLGKIEQEASHDFSFSTNGWDVAATGHLEIAIFDLFAKAGAFFWSSEAAAAGFESESTSGTSFMWGLGAGVSLGPIGIRLEYEAMDVEDLDNLSMLSLGATFGF